MRIITAALPYANGPLHLGHIRSTYLPADIYKRFSVLSGKQAIYVCATDEHGTPIVIEALKRGVSPKEIVDFYHKKDKEDFEKLNLSLDIFHRTHSKENEELTIYFFEKLKENGYVYKKKVLQYYCKELEKFMPDRYIKGTCPYCKAEDQYADQCEVCGKTLKPGDLLNPYCTLTKTKPVLKEVEHYFFKLTAFKEDLRSFLEKGDFQEEVKNYVLNWLEDLIDWDIVRDMDWGIRVPNTNQVFYVWFDAPIGYISSTKALTPKWREYWKTGDIVHFIGKDIIYHHYLFWPAMLMGVREFNLPRAIPTRGYLTLEGKKFSKSRGWYITLEEFLNIFPADYLRYYMTSITPYSLTDANFSFKEFQEKINNDLIANYGNLINRLKIAKDLTLKASFLEKDVLSFVEDRKRVYVDLMEGFYFKQGMEVAMEVVKKANSLLSEKQPWKLDHEEKRKVMSNVVYLAIASSSLLSPFIPSSSQRALEILNSKPSLDFELPERINTTKPLFKKVEDEEINQLRKILENRIKSLKS